ncbi:MAG: hypothetical protein J6Y85_01425 [Alphaproteobacteria bacterium]|nr:hypothetical protein [Alphaproteobacteria bacterium]
MKKTLVIMGSLLLSACVAHDTDLDAQAAQRQEKLNERQQTTGCTFARDHDAYRNCILNTYYMRQPQTYIPAELDNGQPLAVTGPRYHAGTPVLQAIVEPQPQRLWAAPTVEAHSTSVETVCEKSYQPQEAVITTTEMPLNPPPPEVIVVEQEVAPAPAPQPEPQPRTWWKEYQENKPAPAPEPKCPCEDPNDPCPQCYNK